MNNSNNTPKTSDLRQKAEFVLKKKSLQSASHLSKINALKLIHELEVHQVELELINEELINAKERAEIATEKYLELYDFAPSGYFTLSREGRIMELNLSGANILGNVRSSLKKTLFCNFISHETKPIFKSFLESILTREMKQTCEVVFSGKGNLPLNIYLTGIVTEDEQEYLITVIDITKLKLVEEELIKAKEIAEENTRLKSAFLANMSHEIRTPMNGILGFAELLENPELSSEDIQKYIHIITKSGNRMLCIINDIINISKVESGQMVICISESNINEQVEYIYTFFKSEVENKGMQLFVKNALSNENAIIKTDREKIFAILTNLVKNAIKFTDKGSIEFGYEKKGNFLEFFVKDTGSGINQTQKQVIFERFRQGSEMLTRKYEGSGLGLSISKAYVEMLGGEIWVESELGSGSTFYFTIPYLVESEAKITDNNDANAAKKSNQLKNLKVLIVEDNEVSEMLIKLAIKDFSKEVLNAKNGIEAVEICRNNPDIDLVLMDLKMPAMDGIEATREIRHLNNDVIIIAQTAYSIPEVRKNILEAGCNDYISKPFNQTLLTKLLKKHFKTEKI